MPTEEKAEHIPWTSQDLAKLHSWLYCICIVEFDLSEGQRLKFAYPIDILSDGVTYRLNIDTKQTHVNITHSTSITLILILSPRQVHHINNITNINYKIHTTNN